MKDDLVFKYETKKKTILAPLSVLLTGIILFVLSITVLVKLKPFAFLFGVILIGIGIALSLSMFFRKSFSLVLTSDTLQKIDSKNGKCDEIKFDTIFDYKIQQEHGIQTIEIYGKQAKGQRKITLIESLFDNSSNFDMFVLKLEERVRMHSNNFTQQH